MKKQVPDKISILIIENSVSFTGALRSIDALTGALAEEAEFHFAVPRQSALASQFAGRVIQLPFLELSRSVKALLFYLPVLLVNSWRIARYCRKHRIQVVHVNDLYNLCGIIVKCLVRKINVVYHVRLMPDSYARLLYGFWRKLIVHFADRIICVSNAVRNANYFPAEKTEVIYNALPISKFKQVISSRKENAEVTFLFLANYIRGKGQQYAIQAFRLLQSTFPNSRLIFAGSDMGLNKNRKYKHELIAQSQSVGLQHKISFYDFVSDTPALLQAADVVLNFSESESFSMTILEAMYAGVPVVATACGGPAELVEHGFTGFLVPVKDVTAMAEVMQKLANDKVLRKRMGEAARHRASEKFSLPESSARLLALYRAVCR